ncbi:MAG: ABC transporter permease [Candidatus Nanopelagicales bacterium]
MSFSTSVGGLPEPAADDLPVLSPREQETEDLRAAAEAQWAELTRLPLPTGTPAELGARFGLHPIGLRPPIPEYLRQIWRRRFFVVELSRAREQAANAESRLGQFWQVLNPLLNVAVYFLIFGVLLGTKSGVHNYIAFLVIGVFTFGYTQSAMLNGARSITGNMGIVRALHFPRAMLPLSIVVEELFTLGTSLLICVAVVLLTGEGISWTWLLILPAVVLQTMFNLGLALTFARITERVSDVAQLLPFLARTWLYLSGVVFSLDAYAEKHAEWVKIVLYSNPGAIYVELVRDSLMQGPRAPWFVWVGAVAWALVGVTFGFLYFWKAEERYGRG